jgi:hypothetical protein
MNLAPVLGILHRLGVRYALIGGRALAARGFPRFTVDIDLLTTDTRVLAANVWDELARAGATIDARRGDDEDPLAGVVHILLADGTDIDVVVGRWPWERAIVSRAQPLSIAGGVTVPVSLTSDLILLKLAAGGFSDKADAGALLAGGDRARLIEEVESRFSELPPELRESWTRLLTESS